MFKKITSLLISLLIICCTALPVTAATVQPKTLKDKINAIELEPLKPSYWDKAFIKRVENVFKGKKTNYDKLVAVYNYIRTNETDKKLLASGASRYATQLQCALEIVGFRTYHVYSNLTLKGKENWHHGLVGIDISGGMLYFDAYLPAILGIPVEQCFGIPYQKAPLYKNAMLVQVEIEPTVTVGGWSKLVLAESNGIPKSVSKRTPYRSVPDKVYSGYYDKGGAHWDLQVLAPDGTLQRNEIPIIVTDKMGNQFTCYPDGRREPYRKAS